MQMETMVGQSYLALAQPMGNVAPATPMVTGKDTGFFNEFKQALETISINQIQAHNESKAFQQGDPNMSLNEVMVDLQKAVISLQFGIQMRNKMVSAYQEIMNMNI